MKRASASAALAALALAVGCERRVGTAHAEPAPAPQPAAAAGSDGTEPCPRVERAARMSTGYAGWARDIPPEDMVLALDVLIPIQQRLGALFCPPALADCRPDALLAVELTDNVPSAATLRLLGVPRAPERELGLRLTFSEATQWQPDAESLADYLATCRSPAAPSP